jgi:hypothetical protein
MAKAKAGPALLLLFLIDECKDPDIGVKPLGNVLPILDLRRAVQA